MDAINKQTKIPLIQTLTDSDKAKSIYEDLKKKDGGYKIFLDSKSWFM